MKNILVPTNDHTIFYTQKIHILWPMRRAHTHTHTQNT